MALAVLGGRQQENQIFRTRCRAPSPPQPSLLNIQYTKDLSFGLPNAPAIYHPAAPAAACGHQPRCPGARVEEGGNVFEVTAWPSAPKARSPPAKSAGGTEEKPPVVFIADLVYAGVFTLNDVPENQQEPILLVECPRLLFPWRVTSLRM